MYISACKIVRNTTVLIIIDIGEFLGLLSTSMKPSVCGVSFVICFTGV